MWVVGWVGMRHEYAHIFFATSILSTLHIPKNARRSLHVVANDDDDDDVVYGSVSAAAAATSAYCSSSCT